VVFSVESIAVELDPTTITCQVPVVSLTAVDFYRRQRWGRGVFLDRKVIEERAASRPDNDGEVEGLLIRFPLTAFWA
jgi:hypothetical protein